MTNQNDRRNERLESERIENMDYDPSEDVESAEGVEVEELESLNPDFERSSGSSDTMESDETAEPWNPPTDPVILPEGTLEGGADVVSEPGQEPQEDEDELQPIVPPSDDDILQAVEQALRTDAMTSDLDIRVYVRNRIVTLRGSVNSMEEAEAAEEVAGRTPDIIEVREELEIGSGQ